MSVGFAPIKFKFTSDPERKFGIDFIEQELLEFSIVPVPANPDAVIWNSHERGRPDLADPDRHTHHDDHQWGHEPSEAPAEERADAHSTDALVLAEQQFGDDETRDRHEYVDTEET